jgi:release factor glutamine methyltransferase
LLANVLGMTRIQLYTNFERPLTPDERTQFRGFLKRRSLGEPIAYILQKQDFWGRSFETTPDVLIPRNDTELLIETVLEFSSSLGPKAGRLLDVGTGSGCIAISLALELPGWEVEAWDISPKALAVASRNAVNLKAEVQFSEKDALSRAPWQVPETFDFIVSNPPYVSMREEQELPRSVLGFEPRLALFAEEDGLVFYQHFAKVMKLSLSRGGSIFLEVGHKQAEQVAEIFQLEGWSEIKIFKDLQGIARLVIARWLGV